MTPMGIVALPLATIDLWMIPKKEGHLLPDCGWLWVTDTVGRKTVDGVGGRGTTV